MSRAQTAKDNFLKGYTCAQAVLLAFSDVTGLDPATAEKISLPFGGGVGRMREICGTMSGVFMAVGLIFTQTTGAPSGAEKSEQYAIVQELARRFKEKNGSIICRELLGGAVADTSPNAAPRTAEYYKKRPCPDLCYMAAEILEAYLQERGVL